MRVERIGDATVRIYALCEYPSWEPRYVGKTVQHLHDRHKAHIRAAKRGRELPVYRWLRKQLTDGKPLAIRLLEFAGPDWAERERFWIQKYRSPRLMNVTDGGEGLSGHKFTQEHRERIAARLRTGALFDCATCGASFWRKQHEIKQGHNRFCSRECSNARGKGQRLFP